MLLFVGCVGVVLGVVVVGVCFSCVVFGVVRGVVIGFLFALLLKFVCCVVFLNIGVVI